jgi:HlyD family type I secretion membrane fusion protein
MLALLSWSALTEVDMVVTVPVVARPTTGTVELRAPVAARVARTPVPEGAEVAAGQLVVALDAQLARAHLQSSTDAMDNRRRQLADQRAVMALLEGTAADAPATDAARLRVRAQRGRLARLDDDIRALESELRSLRRRSVVARRILSTERERDRAVAQAVDAGALSRFEGLRARQALDVRAAEVAALDGQAIVLMQRLAGQRHARTAEDAGFRESLLRSIGALELELAQLAAQQADAIEQLRSTAIDAPRAGVADRVLVKPGDFVERGEIVAVVVPVAAPVYFEGRVAPRQTAFLAPGQSCRIKLDALPFARYGALPCTLQTLGHDAVRGEGGGYYLARIRPVGQAIPGRAANVTLQAGATGSVDIVAGKRTVLGFFTEPLRRLADESLREL